jgi:pyrroline-5-carboxylate reductase
MVGEGMTAISFNSKITEADKAATISIFESFGKAEVIDEYLMDVVPAISGSSPAYVYMFIEALADGAVLGGIPRAKAYKMAAQAVLGSAKMVLETGKHPGELKDSVCSPAGTTIDAVYTLEKNNFRGTVISAMDSCTAKARKMSEKK